VPGLPAGRGGRRRSGARPQTLGLPCSSHFNGGPIKGVLRQVRPRGSPGTARRTWPGQPARWPTATTAVVRPCVTRSAVAAETFSPARTARDRAMGRRRMGRQAARITRQRTWRRESEQGARGVDHRPRPVPGCLAGPAGASSRRRRIASAHRGPRPVMGAAGRRLSISVIRTRVPALGKGPGWPSAAGPEGGTVRSDQTAAIYQLRSAFRGPAGTGSGDSTL
jgi:hypothetical protein